MAQGTTKGDELVEAECQFIGQWPPERRPVPHVSFIVLFGLDDMTPRNA
jgi:hypothetical protein